MIAIVIKILLLVKSATKVHCREASRQYPAEHPGKTAGEDGPAGWRKQMAHPAIPLSRKTD